MQERRRQRLAASEPAALKTPAASGVKAKTAVSAAPARGKKKDGNKQAKSSPPQQREEDVDASGTVWGQSCRTTASVPLSDATKRSRQAEPVAEAATASASAKRTKPTEPSAEAAAALARKYGLETPLTSSTPAKRCGLEAPAISSTAGKKKTELNAEEADFWSRFSDTIDAARTEIKTTPLDPSEVPPVAQGYKTAAELINQPKITLDHPTFIPSLAPQPPGRTRVPDGLCPDTGFSSGDTPLVPAQHRPAQHPFDAPRATDPGRNASAKPPRVEVERSASSRSAASSSASAAASSAAPRPGGSSNPGTGAGNSDSAGVKGTRYAPKQRPTQEKGVEETLRELETLGKLLEEREGGDCNESDDSSDSQSDASDDVVIEGDEPWNARQPAAASSGLVGSTEWGRSVEVPSNSDADWSSRELKWSTTGVPILHL